MPAFLITCFYVLRTAVALPLALLGSFAYFVYWALAIGWYATAETLCDPE